jgi:Ca2+-transporting ATPase
MQDREAHAKPIEEVVAGFKAHLEHGLTQKEANERLQKLGSTTTW